MAAMDIDQPQSQPYTFDLGHLLCTDPNPLPSTTPSNREEVLASTAQQCAQALITQLLTTCPISRDSSDGALQLTLPAPSTLLPREKPIPQEKEKTKWTKFAEKKGIKAKRRDGKMVYDEVKGDWMPKYGYKGKKAAGEVGGDWIVEVDEKEEKRKASEGAKGGKGEKERRERKVNVRKGK